MNVTQTTAAQGADSETSAAKIQSDVIDTMLLNTTWVAFPILLLDFYRASEIGWQPINITHVISAAFVASLTLAKKRLPLQLRIAGLIVYLFSMGIPALFTFGPANGMPFLAVAAAACAVFYG